MATRQSSFIIIFTLLSAILHAIAISLMPDWSKKPDIRDADTLNIRILTVPPQTQIIVHQSSVKPIRPAANPKPKPTEPQVKLDTHSLTANYFAQQKQQWLNKRSRVAPQSLYDFSNNSSPQLKPDSLQHFSLAQPETDKLVKCFRLEICRTVLDGSAFSDFKELADLLQQRYPAAQQPWQ